jgi:outer membrane receptor protein involved in Fe transport
MTRTTSCAAPACRTLSSGLTACRHYVFFFISLVLFQASASAGAALDRTIALDIAPNSALDDALIQWGAQMGMQIMMDTNTVGHEKTSGMRGTFRADDALSALLRTSGLSYQVSDATVTVISPAKGDAKRKPFRTAEAPTANAQGETGANSSDNSESGPPSELPADKKKQDSPVTLEEVVVTGTHIAGAAPVGSPLISITSDDITSSGYSNIGDVIRSLPQASGGGVNPGVVGASGSANTNNVSSASTVNLRGLGSSSTLTLIDGHRLAIDGHDGSIDISVIPIAAIERVEILTDSASAIYGSDAVAGVANFILKKDYEGAQTALRYGDSTRGGAQEREASQLFGVNWSKGNAMVSFEHDDQQPVLAADRGVSSLAPNPLTLLPDTKRNSVFASAHQGMSDDATAYVEGIYSDRTTDLILNYGVPSFNHVGVTIFGVSPGFEVHLPAEWSASIDGTLSGSKDLEEQTSGSQSVPFEYTNRMALGETQANGPLGQLPSGPVQVAVGAGYRSEGYHNSQGTSASRHLTYEFGEVRIPLVHPASDRIGLERAEISVSGRHERYSDFGSSTTPKIGLVYAPFKDVTLRGSWGKAFRAPTLQEEHGLTSALAGDGSLFGVSAPADAQVLLTNGSNSSLKPEAAHTWSAGFDFTPSWLQGFRTSLTYFNMDYRDRILYPIANQLGALTDPTAVPFILRNPSVALLNSITGGVNQFYDFTSLANYDPAKVVAYINNFYQNAETQGIHGVDFTGNYRFSAPVGNFDIAFNTTWLHIGQKLTSASPETTITGTIFNPAKFRSRFGVTWQQGPWSVNSFVNYVSSETDNTTNPAVAIAPWTTVDAQLSFDTSHWGGWLRGLRLSVSAQNLLDRNPPRVPTSSTTFAGVGFDSTNASALGRFLSISVRKDW